MAEKQSENKKPGPRPGVPTKRTSLMIEEELIEWGKDQPGGLSELVRRLLRNAKEICLTSSK